jgi:hypothetical protein
MVNFTRWPLCPQERTLFYIEKDDFGEENILQGCGNFNPG